MSITLIPQTAATLTVPWTQIFVQEVWDILEEKLPLPNTVHDTQKHPHCLLLCFVGLLPVPCTCTLRNATDTTLKNMDK